MNKDGKGTHIFLRGTSIIFVFFVPALLLANGGTGGTGTNDIVGILAQITSIIVLIIPLLFGLAFVYFLWGMYTYIKAASTEGKEGARETIIYGIIGLFVIVSVWGLVNLLNTTFFGSKTTPAAETNANIFKFPGSK